MKVFVDGSAKRIAMVTEDGQKFVEEIPFCSNFQAEYQAILICLKKFDGDLEIVSDSQVVVMQLRGIYKVKNNVLRFFVAEIRKLCAGRTITFDFMYRNENPAGLLLDELKRR